jgi:hypothetical protein
MSKSIVSRTQVQVALIAGLALASSFASAASQCKGMLEDACLSDGECVWVQGYTRKDGRSVSSHCKLKGGKKAATASQADSVKLSEAR